METFLNEYHIFTECVVLKGTIVVSQDLTSDTHKNIKKITQLTAILRVRLS